MRRTTLLLAVSAVSAGIAAIFARAGALPPAGGSTIDVVRHGENGRRWTSSAEDRDADRGSPGSMPEHGGPIPIRLHPDNPRYFLWRGRPTLLVTSGEHYGAVLNRDFDYAKYLATLASHGFNLTRVFSGVYCEPPGAFNIKQNTLAPGGRLLCPWARSTVPGYAGGGRKFDLDRWDQEYFERLRGFVTEAGRRGIVVEVVLFCTFYDDSIWRLSPLNAANNINGIGRVARTEVYSGEHSELQAVQEAMVRKVVAELRDFDNVYFEICNEPYERPGLTGAWNDRIIGAIADAEGDLEHKHLIAQGIAVRAARIRDPDPRVSIYNFHAAKPESVTLNYDLEKPIAYDETAAFDSPHRLRASAWQFLLAGGAVFNHLDLSFAVGHEDGGFTGNGPASGPEFRGGLQALKEFMRSLELVRMRPDASLIKAGLPENTSARALVDEGRAYAIHLDGGRQARLIISLPAGKYIVDWVDTRTGKIERSETFAHRGGNHALASPEYEVDIALRIRRKDD